MGEKAMDLGLRDKVAVVTAASGGLGRAIAEEFASEGAITIIAARNEARLKAAAEEIARKTGGTAIPYRADCTIEADIAALVGDTVQKHGRLDVMICNSVGPKTAPFDEMTDAGWRSTSRSWRRSASPAKPSRRCRNNARAASCSWPARTPVSPRPIR
jgi:3-oxoacyl-[acyl-carrier protein] reductase